MLLMLGDSLTFRNDWPSMLGRHDIINRGIDGDTSEGILERARQMDLESIDTVCLMMGINDIAMGSSAKHIFWRYERIVEHFLEHNIRVIVQSTLYLYGDIYYAQALNDQVDALNLRLRHLTQEKGLDFVNINAKLSENGALNPIYTADGVHLNRDAYVVWAKTLQPYLQ
jgi:lysophospholipase L1-like esterase